MFRVTLLCETTPLKPRGCPAGWSFTPIFVDGGKSGLGAWRDCAYHFPWVQQEKNRGNGEGEKEKEKYHSKRLTPSLAPPTVLVPPGLARPRLTSLISKQKINGARQRRNKIINDRGNARRGKAPRLIEKQQQKKKNTASNSHRLSPKHGLNLALPLPDTLIFLSTVLPSSCTCHSHQI